MGWEKGPQSQWKVEVCIALSKALQHKSARARGGVQQGRHFMCPEAFTRDDWTAGCGTAVGVSGTVTLMSHFNVP